MKVLVLGGGDSPERDVSLRSAATVRDALTDIGYAVSYLDPLGASHEDILHAAQKVDVVFPILHGAGGEDGTLQALFDEHSIHYLGSDAVACRATYNKRDCKQLLEQYGIPTPRWEIVTPETFPTAKLATRPFVLKPITGGSSIDTFVVRDSGHLPPELESTLARHGEMLLEEMIKGQETTVAVLGSSVLPVVEIIPPADQIFDYENKYNGATTELCPPQHLSLDVQKKLQALGQDAHKKLGCRHLSRTDILIDSTGHLYVIDVNTIPGLTSQSLFPKAASQAGLQLKELVEAFVMLAAT